MKYDITIKGIAPLLQHRFSEESLTGTSKVGSNIKNPNAEQKREIASNFLYLDNKKQVVVPSNMIEAAMIASATEFRLAGAGKKTYKEMAKSSMFVFPELIPLKDQKWEVDGRAVVNSNTKGRSMSYRPRFEKWELSFTLDVTDPRADNEAIKGILETAGLRKGIGAYHPKFGRFEISKFTPVKE